MYFFLDDPVHRGGFADTMNTIWKESP
jgi:hypothetical protein